MYDFAALEDIEYQAAIDLYRAAPEAVRAAFAIECRSFETATAMSCHSLEPASIFRRIVGLGVSQPATQQELDTALEYMAARGLRFAVPVAPRTQPAALASWLQQRGFTPGYAWMKFARPCVGAAPVASTLEIRVIGPQSGADFGRVIAEGFGFPASIAPWIGVLAGRDCWVCVLALDGALPVGAGAAYIAGDHAWLGFGATLASHRRQGAQGALLARRLQEVAARGARVAVTETGERREDRPSNSYRNIQRAQFHEMYLRRHLLSP